MRRRRVQSERAAAARRASGSEAERRPRWGSSTEAAPWALRLEDGAPDDVLELAEAAPEGVDAQGLLGGRSEGERPAGFAQEGAGGGKDVAAALGEGGELHREDGDAVVEVFAELARADPAQEIGRGGGDETGVDGVFPGAADAPEDAFLENAQELALRPLREDVDAVEVEGASGGALEEAGLSRDGAGERAAFVPEELAVEEVVGEGGQVDADEGLVRAAGAGMQEVGEAVLAGAGRAEKKDGGVGVEAPLETLELGGEAAVARGEERHAARPRSPTAASS